MGRLSPLPPIWKWDLSNLKFYGVRGQALDILSEEIKEHANHISQQSVAFNTVPRAKILFEKPEAAYSLFALLFQHLLHWLGSHLLLPPHVQRGQ